MHYRSVLLCVFAVRRLSAQAADDVAGDVEDDPLSVEFDETFAADPAELAGAPELHDLLKDSEAAAKDEQQSPIQAIIAGELDSQEEAADKEIVRAVESLENAKGHTAVSIFNTDDFDDDYDDVDGGAPIHK